MKILLARLALPATWAMISTIIAICGAPPEISDAVESFASVAPEVFTNVSVAASAVVAAWTARKVGARRREDHPPVNTLPGKDTAP